MHSDTHSDKHLDPHTDLNADSALERLETLLKEEREAIVRLDAKWVDAAATEKEKLFAILAASDLVQREGMAQRLYSLVFELRRNGVLLAHARDCLEDAIGVVQGGYTVGTTTSRNIRPGTHLSTTG